MVVDRHTSYCIKINVVLKTPIYSKPMWLTDTSCSLHERTYTNIVSVIDTVYHSIKSNSIYNDGSFYFWPEVIYLYALSKQNSTKKFNIDRIIFNCVQLWRHLYDIDNTTAMMLNYNRLPTGFVNYNYLYTYVIYRPYNVDFQVKNFLCTQTIIRLMAHPIIMYDWMLCNIWLDSDLFQPTDLWKLYIHTKA